MRNSTKNIILLPMTLLYKISPKIALKILFRLKMGFKLDLKNPITYSEKLQWIKLYDRNPLMPICADKYAVRDFVKERGYGHILNELLWEGYNPEDIPFDELPEKFVIKTSHGAWNIIICIYREKLDYKKTIKLLKKWLRQKFIPSYGEWFYGVIKPRIIVERYLENENNRLFDYKFFCFDGEPKFLYTNNWYNDEIILNVYDLDFNFMPHVQLGYKNNLDTKMKKPKNYDKMLEIAKDLSKGFTHVRVDLYNTDGEIYFGELTFTKGAGFDRITPFEFNVEMGNMIKLPIDNKV